MTEPTNTEQAAPRIETFCLGPYQTNCYIVRPGGAGGSGGDAAGGGEDDRRCWLVDFSFDIEKLLARVEQLGLVPEALVLTHAHVDHIAGLSEAKRRYPDAPVMIHGAEKAWLTDANLNLSGFSPNPVTGPEPDRLLKEGDELELCGQSWRVLHTPGHSPGSVSLYHAGSKTCICGDAVFKGSIGRTDFPGCSFSVLEKSIRDKLYTLPDATTLLPGHGPSTTVGDERRTNPFVSG